MDLERWRSSRTQTAPQPAGVALESTIDPAVYYVGPSDVFSVNIWLSPPVSYQLTVTPEGTLIIPTVGEVHVADLKLSEAKERATAEIRKRYSAGRPSVTLLIPRPIVVMVTGNVLNPGSYTLASYNRVDKAVEQANTPQRNQEQWQVDNVLRSMSLRNIRVTRKDGSIVPADITKFLATREDRWNPYLREGDVIVVPRHDFRRDVVGVYGAVNVPGRFEYVRGDSVKDLIRIAYGFTSQAITDSVELARMSLDGERLTSVILDGNAVHDGTAADIPVEPGDRLIVRGRPDLRGDYFVLVEGEVQHPGVYPISRNRTRLSAVVAAAGGFTEYASLRTATLVRQSLESNEVELERLESQRGGVSAEDSSYYYLETSLRLRKEIVTVDFVRLFANGDTTADVVLRELDRVVVPSVKSTIYVFGQVVTPGHVPFEAGRTYDFYVGAAGGLTERARGGDVKIVKARTRQWLSPDETTIEEGDYVWVPKDYERPFGYYLGIVAQSAAIISVAISLVLLVNQLN
jgi:protein involved in polysaccharide export with SLBB domain